MPNVAAWAPLSVGLLVLAPASAFCAHPGSPANNLIVNGSFETGLTGWTWISPTSGSPPSVTSLRGATDGTFAVAFNSADKFGDQVLQQSFTTVAGKDYTLAFDYGVFNSVTPLTQQMRVEVLGSTGGILLTEIVGDTGTNPTTFDLFEDTFIADGQLTTLRFTDLTGASTIANDFILDAVVVLPEPSVALAALTAAAFTCRPRRRNQLVALRSAAVNR